ncbi:MAG: hypothetical protein L6R38_008508 [Xanthoria sp. 2 TBL-2021]|nr:MAG: hypothetical protein L6R38_008508 [Xanthoria sp. 2 TBL-2021]
MPSSLGAPQTHGQRSRKGKKAWRKNVDVSEIQEGLETAREEVIKGGIVAEKPSDALFTLDTTGSDVIRKSHKTSKPLKIDEIIAARSAVPVVSTRKRLGVTDGVIEPSSKRHKGNGVKPQEYERLRRVAYGGETSIKDVVKTDDTPIHDPWAPTNTAEDQESQLSYLEKPKPIKAPSTLKKQPISLLANASTIPAISKPKPATSYNPDFQDWHALLTSAGAKEVSAERARLAEAAADEQNQARIAAAQIDRDDDYKTEEESAWEGFESEYETGEWLKKKRPERKTPAERNKVNRRKEAERRAKWEAQMKKRDKQQKQIEAIAKQVERDARARNASTAVGAVKDGNEDSEDSETHDQILRRRKLGKTKLPEPHLELVLPDELRDSLRLLKPEGNLLRDRFRNIMLQGKLETRNPISQPKKARRSETEKWTYKDFRIPGEV